MASPFYLFRKYQKTFLVIAGVLAMFIFVVADPLMSWIRTAGGAGGPRDARTVVASWDGGSLNMQQLDSLAQRRLRISNFLRLLYGNAARAVEQEGGTATPPVLPNFILQNDDFRAVQSNCMTTRVLADQAKKSGITISDAFINHYLKEWGLRRTADNDIGTYLQRAGLSDKLLFAGLRELLLRSFYLNSYSLPMGGILPEERWQDWKRINERISVASVDLPAKDFLAEVPEPTDAQLQELYGQFKDQEAGLFDVVMNTRLPSPDPGFREPRRVKIQHLTGNVIEWRERLLDTVTEEEIVDYYERNKRTQFVKTSSTDADGLFEEADEPEADGDTSTDEQTSEQTSDEAEAEETNTDTATEASDSETTDEVEAAPSDDESGSLTQASPFRLAAFQAETEADATQTTTEAPATEKPAEPATAEETSAEPTENEEETTADSAADKTATAEEAEEESTEEEPAEEYEPLENVRDDIRRSIARDKAVVEIQKVVDRTYLELKSTYNSYGGDVVDAKMKEAEIPSPPPELSDYQGISKRTGLASLETELLSFKALNDTNVGRAVDAQSRAQLVVQAMFGDKELYEPFRAVDLDGNRYIVCKVEDEPSRVPEFKEVVNKVRDAWRQQEAAKLALAKAEELAQKATESGDPLAITAQGAGYTTTITDMFSWLTFGTIPQTMQGYSRLGDAPPLEAVGEDFMTKAFELQPDQKVALLNHNQTHAYVIQLDQRENTEAELRQRFLKEADTWYGGRIMHSARLNTAQQTIIDEIFNSVGLDYEKLIEILSRDNDQ